MECFRIDWKGFFSTDAIQDQPEAREKGIYVVYETDWGDPQQVRYIGQSQTVRERLKGHLREWSHILSEQKLKELRVCFGIIHPLAGSDLPKILQIESFFINFVKPTGNGKSTMKGYKGSPILIINTGKIGLFKKTMTSHPELLALLKENL